MSHPGALTFLVLVSALFVSGCDAPAVPKPGIVTPAMSHAPSATPEAALRTATSVPALPDAKPFGLAWESFWTMDGEITGIESSTDLVHWQVETQWTMTSDWPASVVVSNSWSDTNPTAPAKFYRAFNRLP